MKIQSLLSFTLLTVLAACGSDASHAAGPIGGHWAQHTGTEAEGMTLEFDAGSDKLLVHTAPEADGSHDHLKGTYRFDAASMVVTVNCELLGKGKGEVWQGKVDGEHLIVASGDAKLTFHKGKDPHEHK